MTLTHDLALCAVLTGCLALAGCLEVKADVPLDRVPMIQTNGVQFFIDPDTGCHYLVRTPSVGGLTPRLTADGKILCAL